MDHSDELEPKLDDYIKQCLAPIGKSRLKLQTLLTSSNSVSESILKLIVLMISIPGEVISRDFENETIFSCGHENSPQR